MEYKYKHIISLGHFCSVALELERFGLRDGSMPFDWLIEDMMAVAVLIENNFADFLDIDKLQWRDENTSVVINTTQKIFFYHDFKRKFDIESQIDDVKDKYSRRIKRFYQCLDDGGVLFIRYIWDQKEYDYICSHYNMIKHLLKADDVGGTNVIIFVSNSDIVMNEIPIYQVEKDDNDTVARKFLEKNAGLKLLLTDKRVYDIRMRKINKRKYILKSLKNLPERIKKKLTKEE